MVQVSRAALRQELELAKDFDGNVEEGHNVGVKGVTTNVNAIYRQQNDRNCVSRRQHG